MLENEGILVGLSLGVLMHRERIVDRKLQVKEDLD